MAPHFCSELWAGLAKGVPVKHCDDFRWDQSVFHQPWPKLDENYNLKLQILINHENLCEIPIALWKFKDLEQQEAFDIACCDNKVQEEILMKEFKQGQFIKIDKYEAILNFTVVVPKLSPEEKERKKQEEKEAKRLKKEQKAIRKAKYEANIKAKQKQNDTK